MEFVSFELAKKLKEKGFTCKYPLAMYNEGEQFCPLYTSADRNPNIKSVFGNREYYDYDDFDEKDFIAPTIEQAMEWLRKEKRIHIVPLPSMHGLYRSVIYKNFLIAEKPAGYPEFYDSYEEAVLAGIEYVLDKLL